MTWGLGAVTVDTPPKGWICPHCGKAQRRKDRGRHTFLFGEPRCTSCAFAFHAVIAHTPERLGHER